ncbi:MAG: nucleoside monophosphate kinase [Mollicutes bacterium]|jgi:adenylate kinase|nr:nucleoside monophosphate kinase [Mollicutes bacterium]
MKNIIFVAPPAAGKGTLANLLKGKYHIPHISTGDILRSEIEKGGKYAEYIKEQINLGKLVSDDIIFELLTERLSQSDCDNGYILDGFPRNLKQAEAYDEILKKLNKDIGYVIVLDIDKEIAKKRIIGRLNCSNCGAVYNYMFEEMKPKKEGICDVCNNLLKRRDDDNEETFNKRYETYLEQTEPIIKYYEDKGVLYRINSGKGKEYAFTEIEKIINQKELNSD